MKKSGAKERRKNERLFCKVPVDAQAGGNFSDIRTVDFSKGGLGFISKKPVPLKEHIAVAVELNPQNEVALLLGQVQWVSQNPQTRAYHVGMQFVQELASGSRLDLERYFKKNAVKRNPNFLKATERGAT